MGHYGELEQIPDFFEAKGYKVVVPSWSYMDRPADALKSQPDPRLSALTI